MINSHIIHRHFYTVSHLTQPLEGDSSQSSDVTERDSLLCSFHRVAQNNNSPL